LNFFKYLCELNIPPTTVEQIDADVRKARSHNWTGSGKLGKKLQDAYSLMAGVSSSFEE